MNKEYLIRIYIFSEEMGLIINDAIDVDMIALTQSFDGVNGCLAIYDGKVSQNSLKFLIRLGITYLPLNNYEDFIITCPNCGERIDDDMILNIYDENLLSGYNILCDKDDCGCQTAKVKYIGN
jgi:hypothetical protein